MNKIKEMFNKNNFCFSSMIIYIILIILIPKGLSTVFSIVPVRLLLSCILIGIYVLDKYIFKNKYNKMNKMLLMLFSIFLLSTIPSFFVTKNLIVTIYTFIKFATTIIILNIFFTKDFSSKQYQIIVKSILLSFGFVIMYALIQYLFGFGLQTVGIEKYVPAKGRVVSTFFNTIYFGLFINLITAFLIYLIYVNNSIKRKIILSVLLILGFTALLLTFSRSSFLVFGGILFLLLILNYKMIFNKYVFSSLIICLVLLFTIPGASKLFTSSVDDAFSMFSETTILKQFLPSFDLDEVTDKESSNKPSTKPITKPSTKPEHDKKEEKEDILFDDYSLEHRKDFAVISNRIANKHILTGVGFGAYLDYMNSADFAKEFSDYTGSKTHPHSAFVLTYAELGIIALVFFSIYFMYLVCLAIKEIIRNFKSGNYPCAVALFVTITGFLLVNIISENAIYDSQIYTIFIIIIGLGFNYLNNYKVDRRSDRKK